MPRKALLVVALAAVTMAVLGEIGAGVWLVRPRPQPPGATTAPLQIAGRPYSAPPPVSTTTAKVDRPGFGIKYLALLDTLLLVTFFFTAASVLLPERAIGPASAITSLIVALVVLILAILFFFVALGATLAMIGLFLAIPFGTAVYLAGWGSFPVGAAAATLGILLFFKLAFCVCVLVASPRFLQNKGLAFLTATSIVAGMIVAFLHGFLPGILASIMDGVGGAIVAVLAAVWAIVVLIWAVLALIRILMAAAKTVARPVT